MDQPYCLVIADDEKIIRDGLRDMVDWNRIGFRVVGCFEDGRETIEYVNSHRVDAILTDIRMDDVSGIEIAHYVTEQHPHAKVIILTGYRDFADAQQAVRYNVFRFLVKPVVLENLETVFREVWNSLEAESSLARQTSILKEQSLLHQHEAKRLFFIDLILGRFPEPERAMSQLGSLGLGINLTTHPCALLTIDSNRDSSSFSDSANNRTLLKESFCKSVLMTLEAEVDFADWFDLLHFENRLFVFAFSASAMDYEQFSRRLSKETHMISALLKDGFHEDLSITVLSTFRNLTTLTKEERGNSIHLILTKTSQLRKERKHVAENAILQRVFNYVDKHYGDGASLATAAEQAFLSPVYFSKHFKEQTGETFTAYLTRIRVEKAIMFLRDARYKIAEVSTLVGYRNPRYFARVFQRNTGYTPRAYRNLVLAEEPDSE